jgi:hypothetical protein
LAVLSNPGPAVRVYSGGRATSRPKDGTGKGEIMPHCLVAIYLPDGYDGSSGRTGRSHIRSVSGSGIIAASLS